MSEEQREGEGKHIPQGVRDALQLPAEEYERIMEERMAKIANMMSAAARAEDEGKPELARLLRGDATPEQLGREAIKRAAQHADTSPDDLAHDELVRYATEGLGARVVEQHPTPEELERRALQRALGGVRALDNEEQQMFEASLQQRPNMVYMKTDQGLVQDRKLDRALEMLHDMNQRMTAVEEEIMFTSSANRYAHLRSGVTQKDGSYIPGLPPAPDWNTLATYVEPLMRDIVDHIKGAPILKDRANITGMVPLDVLKGVDVVGEELLRIVGERGRKYGEESILAMGEAGMVSMIMAKVMRLLWSHRGGLMFEAREDSYIDLAGYCLLTVALNKFIKENAVANVQSEDGVSGGTSAQVGEDSGAAHSSPAGGISG